MFAARPNTGTSNRVFLLALPLLALLTAPPTAGASEPEPTRPDTWDMSIDELRAIGLGQDRGQPVPVPADAPRRRAEDAPPLQASQGRIFVNFDGANLTGGSDDSRNNITQIGQLVGSFAAYGNGPKREAVMQAVRNDWAPFDVIITDTRPGSGDYTMNMTGPTNPFGGGVLGIAPVDCGDSQTHNNITYAFHSEGDQFSAAVQATTIGQEVAHSYGLEHVDEPGDIMNPFNAGGDASFRDQCIPIVQNLYCPAQHEAECGTQSQQNSYAELMTLFGPSTPDAAPPTVSITYPADGDTFDTGASFTITVAASDDQAIESVILFSNDQEQGADGSEPYGWEVADIQDGVYELSVLAVDVAGNETTSSTVTIAVGTDVPPPTTGDGGDGGNSGGDGNGDGGSAGGSDGGGDGGDSVGGDDGSLPPGYGQQFGDDAGDAGCTCRSSGVAQDRGMTFGLLGLLMLGATRRRRRPA
ncbi:MAG: Ig-like domain-containing protein [Nannocystaceae bacterium]